VTPTAGAKEGTSCRRSERGGPRVRVLNLKAGYRLFGSGGRSLRQNAPAACREDPEFGADGPAIPNGDPQF